MKKAKAKESVDWERLYKDAKRGKLTMQNVQARKRMAESEIAHYTGETPRSPRTAILIHGGNTEERRLRAENDRLRAELSSAMARSERTNWIIQARNHAIVESEDDMGDAMGFAETYRAAQAGASQPHRFRDDGDGWGDSPEPAPRAHEIAPTKPPVYRKIRVE